MDAKRDPALTTTQLQRLEGALRAAARRRHTAVVAGPFEVFVAPSADYLLNLAVPAGTDPDDWRPHVAALDATFAQWSRRPRLEYFGELHPRLAAALEVSGYRLDSRAPVLALDAAELAPPVATDPSDPWVRLTADDRATVRAFLVQQGLAYGEAEPAGDPIWLPGLLAGLADGSALAAGLVRRGRFIAGAMVQIGDGIGELAGVWTDPALRRQGLATAVCRRLLTQYFAAGHDLCWLSAAEGALGLYEKLGFRSLGTQLNYGRPAPGCAPDPAGCGKASEDPAARLLPEARSP